MRSVEFLAFGVQSWGLLLLNLVVVDVAGLCFRFGPVDGFARSLVFSRMSFSMLT